MCEHLLHTASPDFYRACFLDSSGVYDSLMLLALKYRSFCGDETFPKKKINSKMESIFFEKNIVFNFFYSVNWETVNSDTHIILLKIVY